MKRHIALAVGAACLLAGTATTAANAPSSELNAQPIRADAIYCVVQDAPNKRVYYSAVFAGDYSDSQGYQQSFLAFVEARYGETARGLSLCFYEATPQEAMDAGNAKATADRRSGYDVTWTGWRA